MRRGIGKQDHDPATLSLNRGPVALKRQMERFQGTLGIILPAGILKELSLSERDSLDIRTEDGKVILSKTPEEECFTGPFTGPFAELSGDPELWGGTMSAVEYEDELRRGRHNVKEMETW